MIPENNTNRDTTQWKCNNKYEWIHST